MSSRHAWFVDSSVILRAVVNGSSAAKTWFVHAVRDGDSFFGSRMLELEVRRVVRNGGGDQSDADYYLEAFQFLSVTDDLIDTAIALPQPLGGADSLHVATAMRLRPLPLTFVTHDAQQARAIQAAGMFPVLDPVTDDENHSPVSGGEAQRELGERGVVPPH